MSIITINVSEGACGNAAPLLIGYAGENNIDAVDFDFSAWVTAYGEGEIYLEIMRAKDTAPYLAILAVDGTVARWTISDVDTAKHGPGVAQLVYQPMGATKKSAIYKFFVGKSLTEPGGDDPWGPIIERMEEILAEVKEQAAAADQSAQDASGSAEDAEAWAVGERGGEPVPATDPTHENNAKYYADEAEETVRTFTETTAPAAVQAVNTAGQTQVQAVNTAGAAKVQDVNTAGQMALTAVSGAQTAAVNAITQKSTEEQTAIQQKGQEVLESIPPDYSDLSNEVDDLKSATSAEQKLGFLDTTRSTGLDTPNLFDINGDNSLTGYYDRTNTFVPNADIGTTDYISVIPGVTYSTSYNVSGFVLWYDAQKAYLTFTNKGANDDVVAIPNAHYVKFQLPIANVQNMVITSNAVKAIDFENTSIVTKRIDNAFDFSTNLLDKNDPDYLVDKYYKYDTGALVDPAVGIDQSGLIPVEAGADYTSNITNISVVWYKLDKTYLSGTNWGVFNRDKYVTAPENAFYVRFSAQRSNAGFAEWQVVKGRTLPEYMPYGYVSSDKFIIDTDWKGLSGVAFGTSLTYRAQTTGGYLQYLPNLLGATIDNQGIGNATILVTSDFPTLDILAQVKNYAGYASKSFCILEGFVNDFYRNADKLGTWKDTGETTVCGCVRSAINHILTQNRNITLVLVLDHYGCVYNGSSTASTYTNAHGDTQFEYYEEIAKVAESIGVPVIKEYELSGMNEYTPDYFIDNIHPSALGAEQSANTIYYAMKNINVKKASA